MNPKDNLKAELEQALDVTLHYETISPFWPNADHQRYQRPWTNAHVKEIKKKKSFKEATPVLAKRDDGTYWVVDHQHHLEAMKRAGVDLVECFVFESAGPAYESRVFNSFQHYSLDK